MATQPGATTNPANTVEKMLSLPTKSKRLSRAIDASMEAHVFMQSCMHKGFIATDQRLARLMRELELAAKRPRHRTITTQSEPGASVAANLLQQAFHADQPNQKWASDTTYIWTQEGWLYLAVVLYLFSRMVVGWSMAAIQVATLVVNALEMALARRSPQAGVLHHSDRGSTYTSESYLALLRASCHDREYESHC